ncbi:MAG: hypothetical protein ACI31G_00940 [Bacilli bacterium]
MKNKLLILLFTLFLLTGCNNVTNVDSSIESESNTQESSDFISDTSDTTSEEESEETTSEEKSSEENSSEEEENPILNNIEEVINYGLNFPTNPNDIGVTFTNVDVSLTGRVVLSKDQVATNGLYGEINQYKTLFIDETGYMYININSLFYSKIKDYQYLDSTIYKIEGEIINNNNSIEINVENYSFLENSSLSYSFASLYNTTMFETNYYDEIENIVINNRGCGLGKIIKIKARYIMKLTTNNLLMYDGTNYFQLNGNDKIGNGFILNSTYDILGIMNVYRYAPGIVFVDKISSMTEIGEIDFSNDIETLSSTDLYKIKYTKEVNTHSLNYEKVFKSIYKFEGYINYYVKNDQINMVMSDTYNSSCYSTYTSALNAKCAFISNDNEKNLYSDSDLINSLTYEYALENIKVSFYYYPYLLNTSNYWMVYLISDINVLQ